MIVGLQGSTDEGGGCLARCLGSASFRRDFGLCYAYVAGGMYRGISSEEMVIAMGRGGFLAFFGAGGLGLQRVDAAISTLKEASRGEFAYGVNFVHQPDRPEAEEALVDLLLGRGVHIVEASAFLHMSPALVRYRAKGLKRRPDGSLSIENRVFGKVSRPEVAQCFLSPAPARIVKHLLATRSLSEEEARLIEAVPIADALTVEGDSGGHTDKGLLLALLPAIAAMRDTLKATHRYGQNVYIGAAGGIGAPGAVAAAFALGADYVLTGSVNQCTVESGASVAVKDLLQAADIQDVAMAPAGDLLEIGSRVQVLRRGTLFAARANKLYELYQRCDSLGDIDRRTRAHVEEKILKASFDYVFQEVEAHYASSGHAELERARLDPKYKMLLVFKWYFARSTRLAEEGNVANQADYQVHCSPAIGAFNALVKGTELEPWRNRRVSHIGTLLMEGAARHLGERFADWPLGALSARAS